jgi:hypothetical protein
MTQETQLSLLTLLVTTLVTVLVNALIFSNQSLQKLFQQ